MQTLEKIRKQIKLMSNDELEDIYKKLSNVSEYLWSIKNNNIDYCDFITKQIQEVENTIDLIDNELFKIGA